MYVMLAVERADRIAGFDPRPAPHSDADDPPLFVAAKSERAVRESAGGLVVPIAAHSQMDVADERQSQSFAPAARVLYRDRQGDAFGEDRARRLSVTPGNVQPAVKPHVVIGEHLASDFTEGSRDVAPRLRRVVRPARRDSVADVGGLNLRRARVGLKS